MRGPPLKSLFSLVFTLLCLGSLLTTLIWSMVDNNNEPHRPPPYKKIRCWPSTFCKACREVINKVKEHYSQTWRKQEDNHQKFKSQLSSQCHGFEKAIITQANTPVGSKIIYNRQKKAALQVTPEIFSTFAKEHPFPNKTWDTCAVVGDGGILTESGCGKTIDSAQFVFRCNLPPLENIYEKDVGIKTDLVTANPSILKNKYEDLTDQRRPFVESLRSYGNSLLLLPAFSYRSVTPVCVRAIYSIEDFESPIRPVFLNPDYIQSLALFWHSQGIHAAQLSSEIIMVSLALELCANVHLYGMWPFRYHPHEFYALTNHYYDDMLASSDVQAIPAEFDLLLKLHSQGVLRLHLEDCQLGEK